MTRLGAVMTEAVVHHYGRDEFLCRMANPFWFQSFGAVMGMDWHSSGITTSVIGALKRGLAPLAGELGIHVCGGRGAHSRKTPGELMAIGERFGIDGAGLSTASRLVAKVDSAAVQDGFDLYLHGFIVTDDGKWVVVQQGMNDERRQARRYHWLSKGLTSFLDSPHAAIEGRSQGEIVNLADRRATRSRNGQLDLLASMSPDAIVRELVLLEKHAPAKAEKQEAQLALPHLLLPAHHDVRETDVNMRRLHGNLAAAADRGPMDFESLLLTPGVGARTVQALALVAEVVHGAPCRFSDPARFSLAHGGKDRHPFPVPLKVYDETIAVMKSAVSKAKLGSSEELQALKRLDEQSLRLERYVTGPDLRRSSPANSTALPGSAAAACSAGKATPRHRFPAGNGQTPDAAGRSFGKAPVGARPVHRTESVGECRHQAERFERLACDGLPDVLHDGVRLGLQYAARVFRNVGERGPQPFHFLSQGADLLRIIAVHLIDGAQAQRLRLAFRFLRVGSAGGGCCMGDRNRVGRGEGVFQPLFKAALSGGSLCRLLLVHRLDCG